MRIIDLRSNHLLEKIEYLASKDLINLEIVCKHFQEFLNKYKDHIQKLCITQLGLEYVPDLFTLYESGIFKINAKKRF